MVNKITWPKFVANIWIYIVGLMWLALLLGANIESEDVLLLFIFSLIMVGPTFYYKRWCITVYEDRIAFRSMFKTKVYYFNEITIKTTPNTRIFDSSGSEVLRVSDLLDEERIISKTYKKYCKENNIRPKRIKKEKGIGYGNYMKIFCIGSFCFSALFILLTVPDFVLIFYYDEPYSDSDYMMLIVCIVVSCLCLLLGIMFLLTHKNTKIRFEADKIMVKNLFGIEKEYYVEDCSVKEGKVITTIYCNDKVIKRMFHYLSDDLIDVTVKIKNREC